MAEGADEEDKTEDPTPKKLREARERGQIAQSREINTWVILFTATMLLANVAGPISEQLSVIMKEFIARPHSFNTDAQSISDIIRYTIAEIVKIAALPFILLFLGGFLASFLQVGPIYSTESIAPKLEKIDPLKGAKRVFGSRAWIEFVKALVKMILVGTVTTIVFLPIFAEAPTLVGIYPYRMLEILQHETRQLLVAVLSILFVFAALDYGMQRFQLMKQLRMSRQELRDEYRQSEGDPHIKAKLRELRMQRARKRMMANVPKASVVITNPTHYAIALEYNQEKSGAPVVVAKGQDRIALKIREVAQKSNVPIVENPPLARAMYDNVELEQEIPEQHYKAVAEVISYVMSLKRR